LQELEQLMKAEAEQNIVPDPEIDAFMKVRCIQQLYRDAARTARTDVLGTPLATLYLSIPVFWFASFY
jgi:hypothetical protein